MLINKLMHPLRLSKTYPSFLTLKEGSTFLTKPLFNSLYDPFGSPYRGQRPSLPLKKVFFYLSVSPARRAPPFSPSLSSLRDERM